MIAAGATGCTLKAMQPGISTHVFFQHRLHPGMLDALAAAGARTIEVFAARHHFDYTDPPSLRETAAWFRSNDVHAVMHQPVYISDRADAQWSRHVAPNLDLLAPEKSRRIAAMDEVKRALEAAELIPFNAMVLHLGRRDAAWDEAALENSLTAIEHLKAFAAPLGVRLLLENLQNDVSTPENLLYILKTGHFDSVGVCLDTGHLHLAQNASVPATASKPGAPSMAASLPGVGSDAGAASAISLLGSRIAQVHLNDNHGAFAHTSEMKDEHLWPGSGSIDWPAIYTSLAALPATTPGILEITCDRDEPAESIASKAKEAFRPLRSQPSMPSSPSM